MYLELILLFIIGTLCICIGLFISRKLEFPFAKLHHQTYIKKENKKLYKEQIGIGVIIIGVGTFLTGAINYATDSAYGWICFILCVIFGLFLIVKRNKFHLSFTLTITINIILLLVVFGTMNYVQHLLYSDVRISLTEIVNQNKDVISNKLLLEVNNLDMISKQLAQKMTETNDISDKHVEQLFLNYAQQENSNMLYWSNVKGKAIYGDGQRVDIAGRKYFQLAMQGKSNISEKIISRLNGNDIFVISVPLRYNDKIIGTIQKQYTQKEMYDICSVSLYSKKGYIHIINSDGYVLINSNNNSLYKENSNYYRMLYLEDPEASEQLQKNIKKQKDGFMEAKLGGAKVFSAYTPIDEVYDWYLITSIETDAVIPNSMSAIKLLYIVLFIFLISFFASMVYQLKLKSRQQAHLEKLAFVDKVTGGNTFTKFAVDVEKLFKDQKDNQYFIVTFDVDGLKFINRFYGFNIGNKVLQNIYTHCEKYLNENESMARISSDNFILILDHITQERLHRLLYSEKNIGEINIYLSAGLYPVNDFNESLNLMIDKAQLAKRKVKGKRIKQVGIYSNKMDEEQTQKARIKNDVDQALLNDEIEAFFQPKVHIDTHELIGAEALARWVTKDGKIIPPGTFIPVCEETGIIGAIDWRIFEKTLSFLRSNLDKEIKCVPISVNFSKVTLLHADFSQMLREKMEQYRVPFELVEVELTETVIYDNLETIRALIDQLHQLGVKISMDDFGSGYSSLQMLKDLDIDVLKIDKSLLDESSNSERQKIVFEAIIQMANKLMMKTVVEGVETIENVELMRSAGSTCAQGYYYSKPINQSSFQKMFLEGRI